MASNKKHLNKLVQISNNEEAALANINANVDMINEVIDDYVSRSGKVPTQMQSSLDMNSQRIINVGEPAGDNDVVRYKDVKDAIEEINNVQHYSQEAENAAIRASNAASTAESAKNVAVSAKEDAEAAEASVQGLKEDIDDLITNHTEILTVANNISDVVTVASDIANVSAVGADIASVNTVATGLTNIDTVATNIADVSTAAANIADIQAAPAYAQEAKDWATKTSDTVDGVDYSSKWYAQQAAAIVATLGNVLRYKGSVADYAHLPTTGNEIGDVWNTLDTGNNYAWDGTGWDDFSGAVTVALAACTDVSLTTPTTGQTLIYNGVLQKWENGDVASSLTDIAVPGDNITFNEDYKRYSAEGSCSVDSDYIATNFSSTSFILSDTDIPGSASNWEVGTKVHTANSLSGNAFIFSGFVNETLSAGLYQSSATLNAGNGTWFGGAVYVEDVAAANKDIWYKLIFDGTKYSLQMSTDGVYYSEVAYLTNSTKILSTKVKFGVTESGALVQSVDLKETYIKANGVEIWRAVTVGKTEISSTIPSKYLYNTATGNYAYSFAGARSITTSYSIGIGYDAITGGSGAVTIGYQADTAPNNYGIAIGHSAKSKSEYNVYIGYSPSNEYAASGPRAVCLGAFSHGPGSYALAVGSNSTAGNDYSVALGYNASSSADSAIQLGYGTNSTANSLSVGLSTSNNYELLSSDGSIPFARQSKVIIEGAGDPTIATVGNIGLVYRNTADGSLFVCTSTTGGYTWEEIAIGDLSPIYNNSTQTLEF